MPINPSNPRIYLASRSPRRRELLTQIGVPMERAITQVRAARAERYASLRQYDTDAGQIPHPPQDSAP